MKVNFRSVTFWYNEGYGISEIATCHSPLRCNCSGRNFEKELSLFFGYQLKEALQTSLMVKKILDN